MVSTTTPQLLVVKGNNTMDDGPLASRFRRRMVTLMLLGYAAFVLVITLSPRMPGSGTVGHLVNRGLAWLHARGLFENVAYLVVEFIGNILMFVPLGVFTALLLSYRHWWALALPGHAFPWVHRAGAAADPVRSVARSSRSAVRLDRVPVGGNRIRRLQNDRGAPGCAR